MKGLKINISDFKVGEVSKYVNKFNAKNFYYSCCLTLKNMMLNPWGGLSRRKGSKFIDDLSLKEKEVRLIAFEHNNNSILMAIYPMNIYFYINGEPLIKEGSHYRISNFWVSEEQIAKVNYVYDDKNQCYYFFSSKRTPSILTFNDNYDFKLKDVSYSDGPYLDMNKTSITLKASATTGEIYIIASDNFFKVSDASYSTGRFVRIAHKGIWGVAKIIAFMDEKKVKAQVSIPFNSTEASKDFKMGAWGIEMGYPSVATIFNGRMYYGASNSDKKSIWISKTGDYTNMSPTTRVTENNVLTDIIVEDNSITLSVSKGKDILWLGSNKDNVLLGTKEGVFTLLPFSSDDPISPFNYTIAQLNSQRNSTHSVSTDFVTFYADWNRENIFAVEVSQDKLLSLSQINSWCLHLFSSKIKDMLYIDYPSKVLCVLMENGSLALCNIIHNDGYLSYSWSSHCLGGKDIKITSMSTSYDDNQQYLWLATKRTVGRVNDKKLIEVIEFDSLKNMYMDNEKQSFYLDLYTNKNMVNNQITGLNFFKDENLAVITENNTFLGIFKVENGVINIEDNIYKDESVFVGYCFDSMYQSPYLENLNGNEFETKIDKVSLLFYKSSHVDILKNNNKIIQANILGVNMLKNDTYQSVIIILNSNWNKDSTITLKQNLPFSMNIISIDLELLNK